MNILPVSKRVLEQFKVFKTETAGKWIRAKLRFDDECRNGHNTFSITGETWDGSGGCIHDEIASAFPPLAPFIKWHGVSTDGPTHYVANTVYHAGSRDCWGLKAGERQQLRKGTTGELAWVLECVDENGNKVNRPEKYVDSATAPKCNVRLAYLPWERIGEGKKRDFAAARSCAVWPDATDEQLSAEPEELKKMLLARLPALMAEFKADMEKLGFEY